MGTLYFLVTEIFQKVHVCIQSRVYVSQQSQRPHGLCICLRPLVCWDWGFIWMFVICECYVLSGRGLCDKLITHPEVSLSLSLCVIWKPQESGSHGLCQVAVPLEEKTHTHTRAHASWGLCWYHLMCNVIAKVLHKLRSLYPRSTVCVCVCMYIYIMRVCVC
jgi:hypothetical protein